MTFNAHRWLTRLAFGLAFGLCGPATADNEDDDQTVDHDRIYQAVQSGRIRPLTDILDIVARDFPGLVIGVEFEIENGQWIYEVVTLAEHGRIVELYFNAASATLIRVKQEGKSRTHR